MASLLQRASRTLLRSRRRVQTRYLSGTSSGAPPAKKTALYDMHVDLGGKMVPFAGYELPIQYKESLVESHLHTRRDGCASLFDVSHMGQLQFWGKDAASFLETVVVADVHGLAAGASSLTLITNELGGIIDDSVITNAGDHIYMVVNGACKEKDLAHLREQLTHFAASGGEVTLEVMESNSLVALQGPAASSVLAAVFEGDGDVTTMPFMSQIQKCTVAGVPDCIVTRCGYTGEDGYEM